MTDISIERSSTTAGRGALGWSQWRACLGVPIGIFMIARLLDAAIIMYASRYQVAIGPRTRPVSGFVSKPPDPGYWSVITNWDGQWYQLIATDGYRTRPVGGVSAADAAWAWAFPPLFPFLAHCIMATTGLSFSSAATALNLFAGALAMVLLYQLVYRAAGRMVAISSVALSSCFISAPLLQVAYSEALGYVLLVAILLLIQRRSYSWAVMPLVALAFTRLITLPIAVVGLIVLYERWRARHRDPLRSAEALWLGAIVAVSVVGTFFWSVLARMLTSASTGANSRTSISTSRSMGWFSDLYRYFGWSGLLLATCIVAFFVLIACSRWTTGWGVELRTWLAAYPAYLLVATPVTGGIFRYLLLCPPIAMLAAGGKGVIRRDVRVILIALGCVVGLFFQFLYIRYFLVIGHRPLMP